MPIAGAKTKFIKFITEIKQRKMELSEILHANVRVEKLNEILKYLLKISYYPMEPANDTNVTAFICKILEHGRVMIVNILFCVVVGYMS